MSNIAELAASALSTTDVNQLIQQSVLMIEQALQIDSCGIFEMSADEKYLRAVAGVGAFSGSNLVLDIMALGGGPVPFEGKTKIIERARADVRRLENSFFEEHPGVQNAAMVAIRTSARLYGALLVCSKNPVSFAESDIEFLEAVSTILSSTIERRRDSRDQSEDKSRHLLGSSVVGIALIDLSGRLIEANETALSIFGYTREDIDAGTVFLSSLISHEQRLATHCEAPHERRLKDKHWPFEKRFIRKDGRRVTVLVVSIFVQETTREYWCAYIIDITHIRNTEAELRRADQLASLGTLAAGVAHEVNNQLAYILTGVDLVDEELESLQSGARINGLKVRSQLGQITEGITRVQNIVSGLMSRSRNHKQDEQSATDVERALESAVKIAWNEIRHRARFHKRYAKIPFVKGSEAQLTQVFLNLLINATQAIPEGARAQNEICISTECDPQGRVAIEVSDTGEGISPENLGRIFDPFFTTKPVNVGTGLGLSVCQGIIADLGGEIQIESEVGVGTTFRVLLLAAESAPMPSGSRVSEATSPSPSRSARILLVDDEAALAQSIACSLSRDHEVVTASNGKEALNCLRANDEGFDVIICDLMMPEMTGAEFYDHLKARQDGIEDRVIFMTGGAFTPRAQEFLEKISGRCIEKPFNPKTIRTYIQSVLNQHSIERNDHA